MDFCKVVYEDASISYLSCAVSELQNCQNLPVWVAARIQFIMFVLELVILVSTKLLDAAQA